MYANNKKILLMIIKNKTKKIKRKMYIKIFNITK
jgi:hypothetical protein